MTISAKKPSAFAIPADRPSANAKPADRPSAFAIPAYRPRVTVTGGRTATAIPRLCQELQSCTSLLFAVLGIVCNLGRGGAHGHRDMVLVAVGTRDQRNAGRGKRAAPRRWPLDFSRGRTSVVRTPGRGARRGRARGVRHAGHRANLRGGRHVGQPLARRRCP